MAGRSDFSSILPRGIKKMLTLTSTGDKAHDREVRKLFIGAHAHHKAYKTKVTKAQVLTYSSKEGTKVDKTEVAEVSSD